MQVIIMGAGWSGLAAAITLIQKGIKPIILEASPNAGGRAREVRWNNLKIDNGQHLLLGAYTSFLELLNIIHNDNLNKIEKLLETKPFELNFYSKDRNQISISRKTNFLYKTKGLTFRDKLQSIKFLKEIYFNKNLENLTVSDILNKTKHTQKMKKIFESICVSALTTNINSANAKIFKNTLKDSLFKSKKNSDLLIPKASLSELFVYPACDYILKNGGEIHYNTRVKKIIREDFKIKNIETNKQFFQAEKYISALPYYSVNNLINDIDIKLESEKITTLYILYNNTNKLPHRMIGLNDCNIDFIFDKSEECPGLISAVSSSNNSFNNLSKQEMFQTACDEIKTIFPEYNDVIDYKIITEKFAAYSCNKESKSINYQSISKLKNLVLAGDYTYNKYPATLESAIRSGVLAAEAI